jgi:hypothetical protein
MRPLKVRLIENRNPVRWGAKAMVAPFVRKFRMGIFRKGAKANSEPCGTAVKP